MRKIRWGKDWDVSEICFGALPFGPLQKNLSPSQGGELIRRALEKGINFIDTAQAYRTYPHIREGLEGWGEKVYIATKSAAETYDDMKEAVKEALSELNRDHIDVFHLHAARVKPDVFTQREGALTCLKEYQSRGVIGKVGIATHSASVVEEAGKREDIEVIFPLINKAGLGILDGDREDMERAINRAFERGKNLYAMKVFAGGNLLNKGEEALEYVKSIKGLDVIAIGMVHEKELQANMKLFRGEDATELLKETYKEEKQLIILGFCNACGNCLKHCPNQALYIEEEKCKVYREKCILCGYCAPHCPQFAIRLV